MKFKVGLALALVAFLLAPAAVLAQDSGQPDVLVQAHRGFSEDYPENTLRAFDEAIKAGANRVETDLALTSDGVVVLMHDVTVDRTTDGQGGTSGFTLGELKQLDAGSWKAAEFTGEKVPTLAEALELTAGRAEMNLEIKVSQRSASSVHDTIRLGVATVLEHDALERVVFSSFDFEALLEVRKLAPEARLLLLDWDAPSRFGWLDVAIAQEFYGWSPKSQYLTEELVAKAKDGGLFIHVGAVTNRMIPTWVEWGVDGFSADDTKRLIATLKKHGLR